MLKINASSLAIGAALAVGAMLVMGQAGPQPQYVSWGPPKAGLVNVFIPGTLPVPFGSYATVYQVPSDRWVTVTEARTAGVSGSTVWAEEFGGVVTDKWYTGTANPFSSSVGWAFRPGSQIVIRNISSGSAAVFDVLLTGYQTRD